MLPYTSINLFLLVPLLVAGLALLFYGGDWLCDGASKLALRLDTSALAVGLTVVSLATSMPELVTTLFAAARGSPDLAVGNIVGSNLANIGLILGLAAVLYPIKINNRLVIKEMPILIFATLLFTLVSMGGVIDRNEGLLLLGGMVAYLVFLFRTVKTIPAEEIPLPLTPPITALKPNAGSVAACLTRIVAGSLLLAAGAELLVGSSVAIAAGIGISEVIIGLTVVAIGTSMPELAASIVAALRRESDLCVGNIIGSNLFNMLFIGGTVAMVSPLPVLENHLFAIEYPAMILLTIILWGLIFTDRKVSRLEGGLLIVLYSLILVFSVIVRT